LRHKISGKIFILLSHDIPFLYFLIGTKVDAAERYTVRNLRIREDTAKYLRNLDPNSAHYDPKTRAMRKNPYEQSGAKDEEVEYAGDNFMR
jgi:pre-mRNA-processing factor SLU7